MKTKNERGGNVASKLLEKGYMDFTWPAHYKDDAWRIGNEKKRLITERLGRAYMGQVRGGSEELDTNQKGVWGELIARLYCEQDGIAYAPTEFLDPLGEHKPDLYIHDIGYDVKMSPLSYSKQHVFVNTGAHKKGPEKEVEMYWFIKYTSDTSGLMWWFPWTEVERWPVFSFGYGHSDKDTVHGITVGEATKKLSSVLLMPR